MLKRKNLIASFLVIIVISAAIFVGFIRRQYVVPILMYHRVNPKFGSIDKLTVSPEAFERQMRFLKTHRFSVLPLEELVWLIREKKRIPWRTIAITFDDGYQDNYSFAFPILKKYNLPATIFVIVNEMGMPYRLTWEEIKIMRDSGIISFGSHTLGPEPLINIKAEDELKRQIFGSKRVLEERLGRKVSIFSYPGGMFNAKIKQLVVDAGYEAAVATSPGRKSSNEDIFALKRLRISRTSDNLFVFWVETSGFYTFVKERRDGK
jgi:peptidoglycan/xylan/chitin deacetylase (PgdA/CDA1 family)